MANICNIVLVCFIISFCHREGPKVESANPKDSSSMPLLSSPRVTNWGEWGDFDYCLQGTYVLGMKLRLEPDQGYGDDSALNAISFKCGVIKDQKKLDSPDLEIQSLVGHFGIWDENYYECNNSYAVGFQLRSEPDQYGGDDAAANNLRLFCSNSLKYLEGRGVAEWGDWTEPQICPFGWAICGLRTQVELPRGSDVDDTALNNLDVKCCRLSE